MKKCLLCKGEIQEAARRCPRCGSNVERKQVNILPMLAMIAWSSVWSFLSEQLKGTQYGHYSLTCELIAYAGGLLLFIVLWYKSNSREALDKQ